MHWNEVVGRAKSRKHRVAGVAAIAACLALACMPIAARAIESVRRETVAVVDTCDQGGIDGNGHGSDMVQTILAEDPNANVITLKALGNDGSGSGSDAARGIREAVGRGAKVIDLSASGRLSGDELTALNDAIAWAKGQGATVYMAAGNFGIDDDGLGISQDAVRVGALGDNGAIRENSDAGSHVDGYVQAESTSRAAAIASARAARGDYPFDKGIAARVARPTGDGTPDDGRLHAQNGNVSINQWCVADVAGTHHWVFFFNTTTGAKPGKVTVYTYVGGKYVNNDITPNSGSWSRGGVTYKYAVTVNNATLSNSALIYVKCAGWFLVANGYDVGGYCIGFPNNYPTGQPGVKIDANGGTVNTSTLAVRVGFSSYSNWNVGAKRTGYDFLGLFTAASGGARVWNADGSANDNPNSYWLYNSAHKMFYWKWDLPVTVYAQWKAHTYTIDCEGNPETGESTLLSPASKTLSATYDSDVTLPSASDLTYKGHTLTGWNTAADGTGTRYAPGATVKNLTSEQGATVRLYAQWSLTPFTVAIYPNGGRTPNGNTNQQTISATNGFCYVGICTRSNYDFAGYKVEGATGYASSVTLKDYGTFTYGNFYNKTRDYLSIYHLTAQWNPWTETIRYDGNGATGGSTANSTFTYSDNGTYNLRPCGFTKTGYSFVGWSTTTDSSGLITDYSKWLASKNGETVTVHAIWKQTTFTITYNANGGSGAPAAQPFTYDNGESVSATKPTRTGYDFIGWNTKADGSGTAIAAGGKIPAGTQNVTLYAQWKAHTYYVKFDGSGSTGGSMATATATYGKVANLPANAYTKAGYTFAGWATSKGGTIAYGDKASFSNLTPTQGATVTLYATWSTNGSTKYTVNHWQEQLDGSYKVTDTQTLYSAWGSSVTPAPLSYTGFGSPAAKTVTVAKDGSTTVDYRYSRHSYGLTVSGILDGRAVSALPNGCTMDVYSNGAKVASAVTSWKGTVKYGAKFEVKVTATAAGYARHADHDGGTASGTMGTSGASYAPAIATTYRISYTLNGGSLSGQPTTYDYYTSRTIPAATRDGYAFAGWTGSNGTTPQRAVTIPTGQTGDKSYTANWTANTYKVTYDANGGSGAPAAQPFAYNGGAKLSAATPTRAGHTFTGWNTKRDGSGTSLAAGAAIPTGTKDLTLYAQWRANTYTVTYDANGGSGAPAAQSFTYGSGARISQTRPTQAGKSFTGWNTAKDGSGTSLAAGAAIPATWQDTTLYAQWATAPTVDAVTMVQDGTDGWWAYAKVTDHGTGLKKVSFPTWTSANWQDDIQPGWYDASSTSAAGTSGSWTVGGTTYNWRYHVLVSDHKGEYGRYNTHVYAYDKLGGYGERNNPTYIMSFTVAYDLGGGTASGNPATYTSESAAFTLKNPTWEGHTFDGWTGTGLSSANTSVTVPSGSHGNRSYKANWTTKTAYLDLNGNFEGSPLGGLSHATADVSIDGGKTWSAGVSDFYRNVDYGTKVVVRNVRAETGYTLTGVTVTGGAKGLAHDASAGTWSFTTSDATTYVVGSTRANTYTVRFDRNSASATGSIADVSAKYGAGYTAPSSGMSWAGHTLSSWNTKADGSGTKVSVGGSYSNLTATDGGTVTLYAQWTTNTTANYTVNHWQEQLDGSYKVTDSETKSAAWGSSVTPATKSYTGFGSPAAKTVTVAKDGSTTVDYRYTRNSYGLTVSGILDGRAVASLPAGCTVDVYSNGAKVASGVTSWRGTVKYGAKFEVRVTATASGYARHADHDGGTASGTMGTSGASYAPALATTYKISYALNGGSLSGQPTTYDYYTSRTIPAATRDGYAFAGWTGSNGTTPQRAVTIPTGQTGDKSYAANWTANTYKVTYDANGGTGTMANSTATYDANFNTNKNAYTRTGYTFNGWNEKADGTGVWWYLNSNGVYENGNGANPWKWTYTHDLTLYAQWKANTYTITYNLNGGSASNRTSYTVEDAFALTNPTRTGYTFTGWTGSNGSTPSKSVSIAKGSTGNKSYTANWTANTGTKYTVYHQQEQLDGTYKTVDTDSLTGTSDSRVTPATKSYTGFTAPAKQTITVKADGSATLTYRYTRNSYTITRRWRSQNADGSWGAYTQIDSKAYKYGATVPAWTMAATEFNNAASIPAHTVGAKDETLSADASRKGGRLTIDANGGNGGRTTETIYFGSTSTVTPLPTRTGYTLTGLYTAKTGGTKVVTADGKPGNDGTYSKDGAWRLTSDLTLYAQWKVNTYTITYNLNGGSASNRTSYTVEDAFTLTNPTRSGYAFAGWTGSNGANPSMSVSIAKGTTGNKSYTANWTANAYTVKFDSNGGTGTMADAAFTFGVAKTLSPNAFSRTGYSFVGWNTKADGSGTSYANGASVSNLTATSGGTVTLYAQWRANAYTIAFDGNGASGGTTASMRMTYDVTKSLTANGFTHVGYSFAGWNTKADGSGTAYADKATVKNLASGDGATVTLYAQWKPYTLTVNYHLNGGTNVNSFPTSQSVAYDQIFNSQYGLWDPSRASKTGYHYDDATAYLVGSASSTKTITCLKIGDEKAQTYANAMGVSIDNGDATADIYINWIANSYTVRFDANGGSGTMANEAFTYDSAKALTANAFTRAGYSFTGWNTKADGSGTSYANGASVSNLTTTNGGTITLYAQWKANSYTVRFDANGGSGTMANEAFTYDSAKALTANAFTRTGYTFTGWNTAKDGSGTAYADKATVKNLTVTNGGTVTLYAQWKVNTYTDTIEHWLWGFKNKEGNNIPKTAYKLGTTSWRQDFGTQVTYDAARQTKVPNGTLLSTSFGSSSFGTSWEIHTMPKTFTQPARDARVEYDYSPIDYKITYDLGGGTNDASNPSTYNVLYGVTLKDPTRKGYEFAGWYDKATGKRVTGINEGANATFSSADDLYSKLATRTTGNVELEARWKTRYVDVTFHRNTSASDAATSTVRYSYDDWASGKAPALSSQGWTRTGYTQLGWSANASDTAADYSVTNAVYGDWILEKSPKTDLYAVWKAWGYKIHFDGNGAASGSMTDQSLTWDKDANLSPIGFAAPTGMRFVGWNTAKDGSGTSYADKAAVRNLAKRDGDAITLYAQWRYVTYKVHFDGNGATSGSMSDQSMTYATAANLTANAFSRSHHVFTGWNTKKDGSGTAYGDKASVKNLSASEGSTVTLYAQWRKSVYTIRYVDQAGATVSTQKANAGENVTIADYTKAITGASFTGWNTKQDGSGTAYKANASVPALSDTDGATITLWLQTRAWTAKVHFDGNGSTSGSMSDQTLTWARAATLARNGYSRAGYTFTGWNTQADGKGTALADGASYTWESTDVAHDGGTIKLYAQWKANTYAINYKANGGTGTMSPSSITEDAAATLTPNAYGRTGYTFTGWNTKADGSGIGYSDGETVMNVTGQMLSRKASDLEGWAGVSAKASGATGALPAGAGSYGLLTGRDGMFQNVAFSNGTTYKVSGWMQPASGAQVPARVGISYVGSNNQRTWVGSPQVAPTTTGWSYRTYTFTKGAGMGSMYVWLQSEGWAIDSPNYDGTNEQGHWYFAGLSLRDMSVRSTDLYAQWRAHAYTVKFDGNGADGGSTAGMDMRYGEQKALTANGFTRVGYTFTGWNTKADGSGTAYGDKASISNLTDTDGANITLYAQWKVNTYTDTIAHWMGGLKNGEGNNGTAKNYFLLGATSWKQDYGTQVTYDATRQAKVPNGTHLSPIIGSSSFEGSWKSYTMPRTFTQPAKDAYAKYYYDPISYKITYDLGGGTNDSANPSTYNVLYGVTLKDPTRKGYEFAGWYDKATGKRVTGINEGANATFSSADDLYSKLATRTTGNVELEARWKTRYVDVTFHRNTSASDAATSTVRYSYDDWASGKAPALSSQGWTRTGYTQLGWSANASDTAADYSVTNAVNGDWILEKSPKTDLYAVWKINQYSVDVNVLIDGKIWNYGGRWNGKDLGSYGDRKLVTFDVYVNGSRVGTGVSDFFEKHDYGSKVELRDIRPAEGFELDPATITSETVPDYDTAFLIRLNQTTYKITYDLAGGTFGSQAAPNTYHIGDAPVTIPTPTRDHHVFLGWTGSNGTTPQTSVTIPTGSTGDRSYSANWRSDKYTVRFDKNSAEAKGSIADMACEWGKDLKAPDGSAYTRTGWHVTSWNTKADGTGTVIALGATTRNLASGDGATVTLYAQWAPNAYAIAYDGNGATAGSMAPTAATYGSDVTLAANAFSRSGYAFAGWSASASGGDEQLTAAEQGGTLAGEIAPSVTAGATGAPDWAPTAWGGYARLATAAAPQAVSANARWASGASGRLALWAAPEGSGSVELALELHLADGSVAYAQRETTTLTAGSWRLVALDATVPATWEGKAVSYAQPAVRATGGAAFVTGLSSKVGDRYADGATVRNLTSERGATVTLHAQWEPRVATVTFDGNGATSGTMSARSLLSDEKGAKAPECAYERRGYEFVGWNTKKDGSGTAVAAGASVTYASLGGADKVTLYAQWQTKAYTIVFDAGNGIASEKSRSVRYLSQVGTLPTATRPGSTFIGWFDDSGTQWGTTTTMPVPENGESITLHAQWGLDSSNMPDHLINGDFTFFPNGSARVDGKGVYINPNNHTWMDVGAYLNKIADYERATGKEPKGKTLAGLFESDLWQGWGGYFTMWNGQTGFGWQSYQTGDPYDPAQAPSGIQITFLGNNSQNFAEIDAHTVGTLYQDIATTPSAIMHMELDHSSVTGQFEAMTVLVGDSGNSAIQNDNVDLAQLSPAALTSKSGPYKFTRPNFRRVDSGATNYGTTPAGTHQILFGLKVPPVDPKTGKQESGYLGYVGNVLTSNANTGWTRWEGFYRVPAGQTATRFTFKTLAYGTNQQQGNLIKHVRFEQWYPLWYDANNFDAAEGGTVAGNLPTPTVSESEAKSYLYYGAGTKVNANTACYLNTVTNKSWDPTKLTKRDASGEELTFLGWSDVPITHAISTREEYEDAQRHIKAASSYKVAKTTVDNRVYAVWARQPKVTFDLNYQGAPDGMLSPDAEGKAATDAVATQTVAGVFTQAGIKDKTATDPADLDASWSTTQGVGGTWGGKVTGVRSGWKFRGWYTSPGCEDGTRYDFSTPVDHDLTLYAKWSRGMSLTYDYATDSAIRDGDTVALSGGGSREVANGLPRTVTGPEYWDGNTVSAITVPTYPDAVITRTLPGGTKRQYQVSLVPTGWGYDRARAVLDGDAATRADVGGGTDCSKAQSIKLDWARTGGTGNETVYVRYDPTVVDGVTTFAK